MQLKNRLLVLCILALIALLLLATGLRNVQFQPGRTLMGRPSVDGRPALQGAVELASEVPLWRQILFGVAFLVMGILSLWMLPPELRKRLLWQMIRLSAAAWLLIYLVRNQYLQLPALGLNGGGEQGTAEPAAGTGAGIPAFHPPALTGWMEFLLTLGLLLAVLALARAGYRYWTSPRARSVPPRSLEEIASIARSSLADLASGRRWEQVILQSYMRMSETVSEKRGLKRGMGVTPREFAGRLEYAGLPAHAVKRLTRLFEAVRYGAGPTSQAEVQEAIACLKSILTYCGAME